MRPPPLTELAHTRVAESLSPGAAVVDATVGNGHDTLFLAQRVGTRGHVYGFDIQAAAIESTRRRLSACADCAPCHLVLADHANMADHLPAALFGNTAAVMFNLGYLPGGEKAIITSTTSTLPALDTALTLLSDKGTLSVIVYSGHAGGKEEAGAVMAWSLGLAHDRFTVERVDSASPQGPVLLIVRRATGKPGVAPAPFRAHQ